MSNLLVVAFVGGLLELYLLMRGPSPEERERLRQVQDAAFNDYLSKFGKSYKRADTYEMRK